MITNQELKTRLVGMALEQLGTAILLDTEHTLSLDVVTLHHLLAREFRTQLHALKKDADNLRRSKCATA